jgi:2-polyprenyl-6-methoxyphenol hydroxylase-like FAD-dependent oxidoreductase
MGEIAASRKAIIEPARETPVCRETEVLVVGGGPAGVAAALAAARNGADTTLIERYNHLGGMATGGLVILIPHMSAGTAEQEVAGICQEMVDRLDAIGGARHPNRKLLGSADSEVIRKLKHYHDFVVDGRVRMSVIVDPELLKCVLNDMIEEAGVKLYLHSWGGRAITDSDKVEGAVFESKSGRQAILSKLTIDTTGDGDIFASAGADFEGAVDHSLRSGMLAVVFRLGDVDYLKFSTFRQSEPEAYKAIMDEIRAVGGFSLLPVATHRDDQVWVNNWVPNNDCLNVEHLTGAEMKVRKVMRKAHEILKHKMPGFEKSFILDTASQIGTRGSRRLLGEYVVTMQDLRSGTVYDDTIAAIPRFTENLSAKTPNRCIPYRSLVPRATENLLVAGRCFSSDVAANDVLNLIPFCIQMGEAAGTAAALSLKDHVSPRRVNYGSLQQRLLEQGAWLPNEVRHALAESKAAPRLSPRIVS